MSLFRRRQRDVPSLNTSSLPDLIFTVLFFFMIVTHMRQVTLKVQYQVPAGTELTKLTKKSATTHIYIGKPVHSNAETGGYRIQMNDKFIDIDDIQDYITAERNAMSPEYVQAMTVSIKADRQVDMGIITDVKQALRKANALRISYSAVSKQKHEEQ